MFHIGVTYFTDQLVAGHKQLFRSSFWSSFLFTSLVAVSPCQSSFTTCCVLAQSAVPVLNGLVYLLQQKTRRHQTRSDHWYRRISRLFTYPGIKVLVAALTSIIAFRAMVVAISTNPAVVSSSSPTVVNAPDERCVLYRYVYL